MLFHFAHSNRILKYLILQYKAVEKKTEMPNLASVIKKIK